MFTSELCLQKKFIELKEDELKENEKVLAEFNARFGNVDIVQVIVEDSHLMNYEQADLLSNYQFAKVIGYLHKKAVRTFDYLVKRTDYNEKVLSNLLSKLIKASIIKEVIPKRYVISKDFQFPILQFISFEAKLTNWKKAILQATINKKFSSYSYVVLPLELAKRLQKNNIKYFQNQNVGLIGVSKDRIEYLYKPKKDRVKLSINPSFISSVAKYQLETSTFSIKTG
ncbi:hypothetical protein G4V62_14075 [Bacillaceae bacterium SIJ1]|uniref:hypothetical protein n=1 Tax=Litoribacterium kuwaitense TaxID=1398745 RepID=UPI0013EDE2FE|nr:hypothetical protein [Litoribacterium kuwaitense]NGP46020.1 hypothetical protein [Litoribacterium kuwaitense]